MAQRKTKVKLNWIGITWVLLVVISIVFFFIATGFIAFPKKYKVPLVVVLALIVTIMGIFSLSKVKIKHGKKSIRKIIVTIINCILCLLLTACSIYVPVLQGKLKGIFVDSTETQEISINAYVMTSAYKAANPGSFANTETSNELQDYADSKFITQIKVDQDNQAYALEDIQNKLNQSTLNVVSEADIPSSVAALYNGDGDVLLLNSTFENTVSEIPGYENFTTDTQILYTSVKTIKVEKTAEPAQSNYTNSSFMVFIAGSDTRSTDLSYYTRTDVDMLMTVDPVNKQVLLISIPRDWYVKNPALGNGYDKLTHLGNNGLQNTIDGLNQEFSFSYINDYFEVNFVTFYNIVEAIGGIDIDNPYAFSSNNGAASGDVGLGVQSGYVFQEGSIHLDGAQALSYVRERYNLPNGDYGRNEHQAIVLQAIINKLTSKDIISSFSNLINNLQGNFLTSMDSDSIYSLAEMQLNDGGKWNFVTYHLGGIGAHNVTASMGAQELYVSYPIADQVTFANEQMASVMKGQLITQQTLPEGDQTAYLPN